MDILSFLVILIVSVMLHEISHGVVANALGDPTAKNAGRLTLNPIPHIDPVGSVILPGFLLLMMRITGAGFLFGWAKPVPVNPANFTDQRFGEAKVSVAGPAANLVIAVVFGLLLRFLPVAEFNESLALIFLNIASLNILLALFNLLPIPPLDGSHLLFSLLPKSFQNLQLLLSQYGFLFLIFFIFFFFDFLSTLQGAALSLIIGR